MLMEARIFNPWARSAVNSYIVLRLFVFLFNLLIFYQLQHISLLSQLSSLGVFTRSIGEYKEFFTELFRSIFPFLSFLSLIRLEEL